MTQQQSPPPIPVPTPQPESDFYFEKLKEGELWLRRCIACGHRLLLSLATICPIPGCFSRDTDLDSEQAARGTIHTFAIVHRGPTPPFRDRAPYVPVIVDLEEGPRMPSNLVECEPDPENIKVGMAVEVVFQALDDNITLPLLPASGIRPHPNSSPRGRGDLTGWEMADP